MPMRPMTPLCSTPCGIRDPSRPKACRAPQPRSVLNALRHQRSEQSSLATSLDNRVSAQRLAASEIRAEIQRTERAVDLWGAQRLAASEIRAEGMGKGTRQGNKSAQRLAASEIRAVYGLKAGWVIMRCSTPCGIRDPSSYVSCLLLHLHRCAQRLAASEIRAADPELPGGD